MKKCETDGCSNLGFTVYQLKPATVVWLCVPCAQAVEEAEAG